MFFFFVGVFLRRRRTRNSAEALPAIGPLFLAVYCGHYSTDQRLYIIFSKHTDTPTWRNVRHVFLQLFTVLENDRRPMRLSGCVCVVHSRTSDSFSDPGPVSWIISPLYCFTGSQVEPKECLEWQKKSREKPEPCCSPSRCTAGMPNTTNKDKTSDATWLPYPLVWKQRPHPLSLLFMLCVAVCAVT